MTQGRRRNRDKVAHDCKAQNHTERFQFPHSVVTVEDGPAGPVARVERVSGKYKLDYAGPLPDPTLEAIREVAGDV